MQMNKPRSIHLLVLLFYVVPFACWFSPVLFSGKILAPGDGLIEYVPNYLSPAALWEPSLGTGYPAAADPLTFTWYFPAILLSLIPKSYNAFAISGYVLAAWFTYLLTYSLTANRLAGWISGILFGFSGFMMGHAGHPSIVHSAAWIPAILLGLERVRAEKCPAWFAWGCFATGQLLLCGHPQMVFYGMLLAGAFAAVRGFSTTSSWSYYLRAGLMFGFGIGIGSVLYLPLIEFTRLGIRQSVTFDFFNFAHLPLRGLVRLFFPYLYGGEEGSIYEEQFFIDSTEQDAFLGFLALALATFAFRNKKNSFPTYFFLGAALLGLLFAMGGETLAGRILFHVPPFNQFRCQGRFLVIFQLAMAVLAGAGVKSLLTEFTARRAAKQIGILLLLEVTAAVTISYVFGPDLRQLAASRGVPNVSFALHRAMFAVPIACSIGAAIGILLLARWPGRAISALVLTVAALADLGQFGMFSSWRYYSLDPTLLDPPPAVELVRASPGRSIAVRGFLGNASELPPNRSKLWGVASLNKYGSLAIERYHSLAGMDPGGTLSGPWWNARNRALDVLGARYILTPDADIGEMDRVQGIPIPADDLADDLGESAAAHPKTESKYALDKGKRFTSLALVSFLRNSVNTEQGSPVVEIRLKGKSSEDSVIQVLAGKDTAEFMADCGNLKKLLKHNAATVFKNTPTERDGKACQGHFYFAQWPLSAGEDFSSLELKWLGKQGGIQLSKLVLWNSQTGVIQAITHSDELGGPLRLVKRGKLARIYENRRAMPRTWLAPQVVRLPGNAVKQTIQTSLLPDRTAYDPWRTALVEELVEMAKGARKPEDSAVLTRAENTFVEIRTHSAEPRLLVLGDLYYPGWVATVNGHKSKIIQTNYVQRGVVMPAGDNIVQFTYRPASLYLGLGFAAASILGIAFTCWRLNATSRNIA